MLSHLSAVLSFYFISVYYYFGALSSNIYRTTLKKPKDLSSHHSSKIVDLYSIEAISSPCRINISFIPSFSYTTIPPSSLPSP